VDAEYAAHCMSARVLKEVVLCVSESPLNFAICSYMTKGKIHVFTANCGYSSLTYSGEVGYVFPVKEKNYLPLSQA
jgi:hypothetical protein